MLMNRMGVLRRDTSVLHPAPEPGLFFRISQLCREYKAVDYDPCQYDKWNPKVEFIDLCKIDETLEGTFDLIIHNHVLEHIPCSVSSVLAQLRSRLNQGGIMLFSVPIRPEAKTTENLDSNLTHEDRKRLFGQWDHLRIFGDQDVLDVLRGQEENPVSLVNPEEYLAPSELSAAFVPWTVSDLTGDSIFQISA
jgi:SAM-dependent methyltransferase